MARHASIYDGERMTAFVGFYVTPTAFGQLKAAAAQHGAGMSDFARQLLLHRLGLPRIVAGAQRDPEIIAIVRAIDRAAFENSALGNNRNQIARIGDTNGELGPALVRQLDELMALIRKAGELHVAALDLVIERHAPDRAAEAA